LKVPSLPILVRGFSSKSTVLSQEENWPGNEEEKEEDEEYQSHGGPTQPHMILSGYQLVRTYAMGELQLLEFLNESSNDPNFV
jgi:hypothetical protein